MKNKYAYVWVSLVVLIFGIIFIPKIVDSITSGRVVKNDRMNLKDNTGKLAFVLMNGKKRKVPAFEFFNQDSLLISNEDYKGKVYVVEFFFTSCPSICPVMTENLVAVQNEFLEFDDFGIASFSITPDYDTPRVLKEYAEQHSITDLDWHLLTGDKEKIYELANVGFNIYAAEAPDAPGGFEHAGLFALIDKNGYIRSRVGEFGNPIIYYRGTITRSQGENEEGEKEQISVLKEDIEKLLKE
ncbi:Cytochrome oxidase biogenesis protein Sco1/SenC/PrrC, thiol-disulfide reductase involved in Cu(I) insertion into CoxII Cu(A) center [hydrothermal vent metagenome]|uniref:Cytochrome oxidase biogenesis protein Sco1/SenC/PrrC, thiol-disulfide reductase involved in Cu(I) insertion into CoxII Cu(A) center n=1 Tax=hydrothermal vent metagenome TaxID=652676 RepID=A0A3B0TEK0_9ZZZZ